MCYRRKPRPPSAGSQRFAAPKLADPLGCECEKCERYGPIRDDEDPSEAERNRPGHGWLRISDDSVSEVGIETVLQEGSGAFMLYYERVTQSRPGIYPLAGSSPRGSEETLKPLSVGLVTDPNMSTASLATVGIGNGNGHGHHANGHVVVKTEEKADNRVPRMLGPRIVRSVAPARGRSSSAAPSELTDSREGSIFTNDDLASKRTPLMNSMIVESSSSQHRDVDLLSASLPNLPPPSAPASPPLSSSEMNSSPPSTLRVPRSPLQRHVQLPQPVHPGQATPPMVGLRV